MVFCCPLDPFSVFLSQQKTHPMYPPITPPPGIPASRDARTKQQVKAYFAWFMSERLSRVAVLETEVRKHPGMEEWSADFSPQSLAALGEWFAATVAIRKLATPFVPANGPAGMPATEWELAGETFTRCFDVGIYLGEVLVHSQSGAWVSSHALSTRSINYGDALVKGVRPTPCNPGRLMVTLAYGLAAKEKKAADVARIYHIWAEILTSTSGDFRKT